MGAPARRRACDLAGTLVVGQFIDYRECYIEKPNFLLKTSGGRIIKGGIRFTLVQVGSYKSTTQNKCVLTPVSAVKALACLLPLDELLGLLEPQKWIIRPIWGL